MIQQLWDYVGRSREKTHSASHRSCQHIIQLLRCLANEHRKIDRLCSSKFSRSTHVVPLVSGWLRALTNYGLHDLFIGCFMCAQTQDDCPCRSGRCPPRDLKSAIIGHGFSESFCFCQRPPTCPHISTNPRVRSRPHPTPPKKTYANYVMVCKIR